MCTMEICLRVTKSLGASVTEQLCVAPVGRDTRNTSEELRKGMSLAVTLLKAIRQPKDVSKIVFQHWRCALFSLFIKDQILFSCLFLLFLTAFLIFYIIDPKNGRIPVAAEKEI